MEVQLVTTIVERDMGHQVHQEVKQEMDSISQNINVKIYPKFWHQDTKIPEEGYRANPHEGVGLLYSSWKNLQDQVNTQQ